MSHSPAKAWAGALVEAPHVRLHEVQVLSDDWYVLRKVLSLIHI